MSNANQHAFAAINELGGSYQAGLTKREYFAGLAMQGYLASYEPTGSPNAKDVAVKSVQYADALLKQLENIY